MVNLPLRRGIKPLMVAVAFILVLSMLIQVMSLVQTSKTVQSFERVSSFGLGIYWGQDCTDAVSSIEWGRVDPGLNVNKIVYLRNEGNIALKLSLSTVNWEPSSASSYITLAWNYEGQTINPNQVVQVRLTLSVSASISGITNFGFDIYITRIS